MKDVGETVDVRDVERFRFYVSQAPLPDSMQAVWNTLKPADKAPYLTHVATGLILLFLAMWSAYNEYYLAGAAALVGVGVEMWRVRGHVHELKYVVWVATSKAFPHGPCTDVVGYAGHPKHAAAHTLLPIHHSFRGATQGTADATLYLHGSAPLPVGCPVRVKYLHDTGVVVSINGTQTLHVTPSTPPPYVDK